MKRSIFIAVLFSLCLVAGPVISHAAGPEGEAERKVAGDELRNNLKRLWEDHTIAKHTYVVSTLTGEKDAQDLREKLLKNCDDLGDVIGTYYGEETGARFAFLWKEHMSIADKVMEDVTVYKYEALKSDQENWNRNADDIASLLNTVNAHISELQVRDMLYQHIDYTTDVIMSRFTKRLSDEMHAADKDHEHMLKFADMLADGIIKQFPDKFGK